MMDFFIDPDKQEYPQGTTPCHHSAFNIGGEHIPAAELSARHHELDRTKMIVTYCTSGGNSMRALQYLLSMGFTKVKSLDGGMTAWIAAQ